MNEFKSWLCVLLLGVSVAMADDSRPAVPYKMVLPPNLPAGYFDAVKTVESSVEAAPGDTKVAVLVDSELYPDFATDISNYEADVEARFPVDLLIYNSDNYRNMTFEQVRAQLQTVWQSEGIEGAVLVGFFPSMLYQVRGQGLTPMAQMMGYEDLDGSFTDEGEYVMDGSDMVFQAGPADGIYDHHYWNNNGMDIWCSIIRPYQPTASSTEYTDAVREQLHDFFRRTHAYYNEEMVVPRRGMAYVNKDWWWDKYSLEWTLNETYGADNTVVYAGGRNAGSWYLEERAEGFEVVYLYSHSASWYHQFDRGPHGDVQNTELIRANGRGAVITYGFNCHGADYVETPTGCMGQHYVFGSELGQAYVGCTISTGVMGLTDQAEKLRNGGYLGEVFFEILNETYDYHYDFDPSVNSPTLWGQIIHGNPFVTAAQGFDPSASPASISGTVSGAREVRLTIRENAEIVGITYSDRGAFSLPNLDGGDYEVIVETTSGALVGFSNLTVNAGQDLTWNITLPEYGPQTNSWYYFNKTSTNSLPSGWNDANADMALWDGQGPAPVGYQEEADLLGGTGIDDSETVYIRKDFSVTDPGNEQRVWVYGKTKSGSAPQVWVNGAEVTMTPVDNRSDLTYWEYRGNIKELLSSSNNYIVASASTHLDLSAPVYSTEDLDDRDPPMPNPCGFIEPPFATGARSVSMRAETCVDALFDVEYYFDCVEGGGHDSGWQSSPQYTDSSLSANKSYAYRVKTRDTSTRQNEGSDSDIVSVVTYPLGAATSTAYDCMEYGSGLADHSYGWSSDWTMTSVNGTAENASFGLSYPGQCTEGRSKIIMPETDTPSQTISRNLSSSFSSGTVWMSVLVQAEKVGSGHLFIAPNGNLDAGIGKKWGSLFSINNTSSSQSMVAGQTYFLVARYDLRSGNDSVYMWVDPVLDSEPQIADAATSKTDKDLGTFTKLNVALSGYGAGIYYIDEIRMGSTWDSVAGVLPLDTVPPISDPASFSVAPHAASDVAISMTAVIGADASGPVEYLFTEASGNPGATNSGWQESPNYTDSGLSPSTSYTYTVQMRDSLGNVGSASSPVTVTTDAFPGKININLHQSSFAYDMGTLTSSVESGWTRISPSTYGDVTWAPLVQAFDAATGNDLEGDGVCSSDATVFEHAIANGNWEVVLQMGDERQDCGNMNIGAEGLNLATGVAAKAGIAQEVRFDVKVSDGSLTLEFSDVDTVDPHWSVYAMLINVSTNYDGDLLMDAWEMQYFGDLGISSGNPGEDFDRDGLDDAEEELCGTDPTNPDCDDDGMIDGNELHAYGTLPLVADSDGDGYLDGYEIAWRTSPESERSLPAIPGLVAYYPFDEGTGSQAHDIAANDGAQDALPRQGSINWTSDGMCGGALDLSATASLLAPDAIPADAAGLTMAAWVMPKRTSGYKGVFTGRDIPGNWGLNVEDSHGDYRFAETRGASFGLDSEAGSFSRGVWRHMVLTWESDGENAVATAYLDGVVVATETSETSTLRKTYTGPTLGYFIGCDGDTEGREFSGQIDDLAVFSTALSAEKIAEIHNNGREGKALVSAFVPDSLAVVAHRMNADSGQMVIEWDSTRGAAGYSVLCTTELTLPIDQWTVLSDWVINQGNTTSFTDPSADATCRFYMVIENP